MTDKQALLAYRLQQADEGHMCEGSNLHYSFKS